MKHFFKATLIVWMLALSSCATLSPPQLDGIGKVVHRTPETPLVLAIPGLNIPFQLQQDYHFGELTTMLAEHNIPSKVLVYDHTMYPNEIACLADDINAASITRILRQMIDAVSEENEVRKKENLPPVKNVVLVGYSQGAVISFDLWRRFSKFRNLYDDMLLHAHEDWTRLQKDSEMTNFLDHMLYFLALLRIRVQRSQEFGGDVELERLFDRERLWLADNYKEFRNYLISPDSKNHYPKLVAWFQKQFPQEHVEESIDFDFFAHFVVFRPLAPYDLSYFMITGSLLGAPKADSAYSLVKMLPSGMQNRMMMGNEIEQLKQTRLGSGQQLNLVEYMAHHKAELTKDKKNFTHFYFILGANGDQGDGLVEQCSAHLSEHLISYVSNNDFGKKEVIHPKTLELPLFPVTGLPISHLPKRQGIFGETLGAAEMTPQSKVFPFLLAFLQKQNSVLANLHAKENKGLRQFMVELHLPKDGTVSPRNVSLTTQSNLIEIKKCFTNPSSDTVVWQGRYKTKDQVLDLEEDDPNAAEKLQLELQKKTGETLKAELIIEPGITHFVRFVDDIDHVSTTDPTGFSVFNDFFRDEFFKKTDTPKSNS